jgi:hypothetical protein
VACHLCQVSSKSARCFKIQKGGHTITDTHEITHTPTVLHSFRKEYRLNMTSTAIFRDAVHHYQGVLYLEVIWCHLPHAYVNSFTPTTKCVLPCKHFHKPHKCSAVLCESPIPNDTEIEKLYVGKTFFMTLRKLCFPLRRFSSNSHLLNWITWRSKYEILSVRDRTELVLCPTFHFYYHVSEMY